jgi:hypothetical protein
MTTAVMTESKVTLSTLLAGEGVTQAQLAAHLDALDVAGRVSEVRAVPAKLQKKLWQVCAGAPAFTLDELVPPATTGTIIYAGKNSLPAFTIFEKRFCRKDGKVIGFNFQSTSLFTGPGYFTVVTSPHDARELLFDYITVPAEAPQADWPKAKPNTGGFAKLVYGNLHDFCRRVSRDVLIGSATRVDKAGKEKDIDSYFILART